MQSKINIGWTHCKLFNVWKKRNNVQENVANNFPFCSRKYKLRASQTSAAALMGFFQTITPNVVCPIDHHADYFQSASNTNTSGRYVSLRIPVPAGNLLLLYTGSRKYLSSFCVVSALSFCPSGTGNERWLSFVDRPPSFPFAKRRRQRCGSRFSHVLPAATMKKCVGWNRFVPYTPQNTWVWMRRIGPIIATSLDGIPGPFFHSGILLTHNRSKEWSKRSETDTSHLGAATLNAQPRDVYLFYLFFLGSYLDGRRWFTAHRRRCPLRFGIVLSWKRRNEEQSFYLLLAPTGDTQHGVFSRKYVLSTFQGIFQTS